MLASALVLFVELALIRWTGANVLHLSYFSNFILLGSFLGVGLGFLRAKRRRDLSSWWPVFLAPFVALVLAFPVQVNQNSDQILYFTSVRPTGAPSWVTLPVIFLSVAAVMTCLGEGVGRLFGDFAPLTAYRLDLIGSLLGICLFTGLSFIGAPPVGWGLLAAAGFFALHGRRFPRVPALALVVLVVLLGAESLSAGVSWSPYYKVQVREAPGRIDLSVNGIPHQSAIDITKSSVGLRATPYQRIVGNRLRHVLIVGAGNGTDVAVALARGAKSVDAVEIDPRLAEIGRQRHPNHPYQNPRVHLVIDDGRAFLQRTTTTYDLIIFALPDSLTLVSGNSSLRLESYLFTRQAIEVARSHLAGGGAFAMYNSYRQTWLIDRYGQTLADVFGHMPCIDSVGGGSRRAALVVGQAPAGQRCEQTWRSSQASTPVPATDDHPFPYLYKPGIPSYYLWVLLGVLLVALVAVRAVAGPLRQMRPYADLFFMGAAFLLLETRYVTGFALLFGSTWLVNAIVFAGVLLAVLAAVETSRRVRALSLPWLYVALGGALAVGFAVPLSTLLSLSTPVRLVAAVALAFAPVFIANLIFASRFAATSGSTAAFGANLIGALLGGALEYVSLVIGYRNLLLVAGGLYLLAFLLQPRSGPPALARRAG
ncbi:MAG: spermidine synthase [Actinomycetota bacterium]|nr:spermidine synthase [Actinomycetota bacterium]